MTAAEARALMAEHADAIEAAVDAAPPLPVDAVEVLRAAGLPALASHRVGSGIGAQDGRW